MEDFQSATRGKDNSFHQPQDVKFTVIEEENKYFDDSMGNDEGFMCNFVSGQIPPMEGFDLGAEGEGFDKYPSHTPVAKSARKRNVVGTDEDRNSKGITGLLELAGTQYQMDQIGEEGESS